MPSKGSKIIIGFFILIVFLTVGVFFLLNQPKFLAKTALYFLKKSSSNIFYKELTLEKVQWRTWNKPTLEDLKVKCRINQATYVLSAGHVDINHLNGLIDGNPIDINIQAVAISNNVLNVSDMQVQMKAYFDSFHYQHLETIIKSPKVVWNRYVLKNIQANLVDNGKQINLNHIQARFYEGTVELHGIVNYSKDSFYNTDIRLIHVNSILMSEANEVFSQLTAVVDGLIKLDSNEKQGLSFSANIQAPLGGYMKASLLMFLAQYVPQRVQIEDLIRHNARVALDNAEAQITSVGRDNLSSDVSLNSSSLNLKMKVKFDIHVEGGLEHLLEYIH